MLKVVVQSTLLTPRLNRFTRALPPYGSRDPPRFAEGGALPYEGDRHCLGLPLSQNQDLLPKVNTEIQQLNQFTQLLAAQSTRRHSGTLIDPVILVCPTRSWYTSRPSKAFWTCLSEYKKEDLPCVQHAFSGHEDP